MKDVAVAAGVSIGTVSNVLNGTKKVTPATALRVTSAIEELGFVRHEGARQLKAGRSRCVGLVVLDIGNPFFADVIRGADRRAAQDGLIMFVGSVDGSSDRQRAYLDTFNEQRVSGVIVSPCGNDLTALYSLKARGTPVVLVDQDGAGGPFSSVSVDDVAGGRIAVDHLCATGRRRIGFVGDARTFRQVVDRLSGARDAALHHPGTYLRTIDTDGLTVAAGRDVGERIAAATVGRPDALFCANDLLAIGVLQALTWYGIRVPDDIAIVGYDDNDFAQSALVPLTSVRQPGELLGATAVELLAAASEGNAEVRHVRFTPALVSRESTADATCETAEKKISTEFLNGSCGKSMDPCATEANFTI
ncbi:LacI family DNA-binding transcriptional regulator [Nocardia thailandica]